MYHVAHLDGLTLGNAIHDEHADTYDGGNEKVILLF